MRLRAALESPELAAFVAALDPVNALADQAPGFVWRLQTEAGDASALRIFGDDSLLVNMSTWRSLEAMTDYVYRSAHAAIMRRQITGLSQDYTGLHESGYRIVVPSVGLRAEL
jgi:hypothetical protein